MRPPYLALVALALLLPGAAPADATVITFGTAPGGAFGAKVTQGGFTYSTYSGSLFVDNLGDPSGQDMEGSVGGGGGVLAISGGGLFTYSGLDFAAYDSGGSSSGTQTLTVRGFLNGVLAGTDTYTLTDTNAVRPTYSNWSVESASALAGKRIDDLLITLDGGTSPTFHNAAIDNVVVTPAAAVPEPTTFLLFGGFVLALLRMRAGQRGRSPLPH